MKKTQFGNLTFTRSVDNFSVPLLVGLAGDHNNDDDHGDDDDEKKDDGIGNVIVDHDDLAGDHDVLGEVRTAWIFELLLNVLAPVAHLIAVIIPHICHERHEYICVNFFGQCKFLQI